MPHEQEQPGPADCLRGRIRSRARKACRECHLRKRRCDVVETGPPCSNCSAAPGLSCVIRRKKASRQTQSLENDRRFREQCQSFQLVDANGVPMVDEETASTRERQPLTQPSAQPVDEDLSWWQGANDLQTQTSWDNHEAYSFEAHTLDPGSSSTGVDFSHLLDIDDIFAFTREKTLFRGPSCLDSHITCNNPDVQQHATPSSVLNASHCNETSQRDWTPSISVLGLSASEEQYLQREGCLRLPPPSILKQIMWSYFYMVHPNLPIVPEEQVWSLWDGDEFRLEGGFSFCLMRAMVFAATNFVEPEILTTLGFQGKREARLFFYKQAKIFFDVGIERDPIALAQSCLLLTYYAPSYNSLRVNSIWLKSAIHFARIAGAHRHHRTSGRDTAKSSILKRIWWGVILRDRILSLGLRRTSQVELGSVWSEPESLPSLYDFEMELGQSPVHNLDAQHRIVVVISTTCGLMQHLTEALQLYRYERLEERLEYAETSLSAAVHQVRRALSNLGHWHDQAIYDFPFPIGLDDADETPSICIYANMMFCYYSSAVFALNQHLILLAETFPRSRSLFSIDQARESLETSNRSVGQRIQEVVQVRLVKYLPISASAFIAIPLVLQAINVAAVRGTKFEAIENRRLQIFTRTLKSQQNHFDGSDFCSDVLSNIVAYALKDEKFQSSMANWRNSGNTATHDSSPSSRSDGQTRVRLDWANLVHRRPRLFLRLMGYLDHALCTGGPPSEDDLLLMLRESVA